MDILSINKRDSNKTRFVSLMFKDINMSIRINIDNMKNNDFRNIHIVELIVYSSLESLCLISLI